MGKSAQYRRKHVLELWAKANGKASPTEVLDEIFLDKVTPCDRARRFLDQLREKEVKCSLPFQTRSFEARLRPLLASCDRVVSNTDTPAKAIMNQNR